MLASFPGSFLLLAVRAGPYCKQQEAGRRPWSKDIDVQLPTVVSRSSQKHSIIYCAAVSSMRQLCHTLVVNYFCCTSATSSLGFNEGRIDSGCLIGDIPQTSFHLTFLKSRNR